MDKHTVFVKTDAGREALAQRAPGLLPRLRSLLIMVDGQRPAAAFDAACGGADGAARPLLEQLLAQGWVQALAVAVAAPVAAQLVRSVVAVHARNHASRSVRSAQSLSYAKLHH